MEANLRAKLIATTPCKRYPLDIRLGRGLSVRRFTAPGASRASEPISRDPYSSWELSAGMSGRFDAETGFDPTYAERHKQRNTRKIRRILAHIDAGDRFLDIGCNSGYVAAALLRANKARQVDAIELSRSIVDPALLEDPRFNFYEGPVTDYPFRSVYAGTIYCAVHHHVFGLHGKSQAFTTWRKIIEHSNHFVLFETGQIAEGDRHYWQRAIHSYYSTDEEHLRDLLHAIGPRLKNVSVIDHLPMHGVNRVLLKIELHPRGSSYDIAATGADAYGSLLNDDSPWIVVKRFRRTIGSRSQRLVDFEEGPRDHVSDVYEGTTFYLLRHETTGQHFFAKHTEDNPFKLLRELKIVTQLNHPRIVKPVAFSSTYGLIFPYLPYVPLRALSLDALPNAERLIGEILEFFEYARETEVKMELLGHCESSGAKKTWLIDVVDLNVSNVLIGLEEGEVLDWSMVDFEYVGNQNRARNERNLAAIMEMFGYDKRNLIVKNPMRSVLKRTPYWS
ncbi:MAG: methyltransferase domain-containing protein, partial [Nitrospiraceae bacterium]